MEKRRGPRDPIVRRRPRQQQIIELPPPRDRRAPTDPSRHAKLFALSLLGLIAAGALLLATPLTTESGRRTPAVDALFTAVSAGSVTGLVTVDTQDHWNLFGEIVILALIQAGGLGFIVGASLILQALRRGQTRLNDLVLLQQGDPTVSLRDTGHLVRRIVQFVILTEAVGAIFLAIAFSRSEPIHLAVWYGLFHAVSAFCNAGIDLNGEFVSMGEYRSSLAINAVMMLLIQAGALSYLVLSDVVVKRSWRRLALDTKLVLTGHIVLLAAGAILFAAAEWSGALAALPERDRPIGALFQSVAARTSGFSTVPFDDVKMVTLFTWIGIMLVGGASGSAAGGAKIATVAVVVAAVISTLRGREEPTVFGRRLATPLVFRAMAVIVLVMILHFLATLTLTVTEDLFSDREQPFIALMFEAMSAVSTTGLSTGITPDLADASKLALCAVMFIGRLGPLTAAYALQRRQRPVRYRLPEAPVRIG